MLHSHALSTASTQYSHSPSFMSLKRRPEDPKPKSDCAAPEDKRRKGPAFTNVVREVMKLHSVRHLLEPILEPLIRRVVKEEVELALRRHLASLKQTCGKEIHVYESRSLQLQFENNISLPVFTGARIEGEDGSNLRIGLVDSLKGEVVSSGPESSARVEIVVLEGDFEDENDIWVSEDFKNNIVREREGKKALLMGDVVLHLKDGVGMVGEISFTDNSSWTRSRRFRLGARVVDNFDGIIIREAKTESFIVRDHRGELYRKHHPPSLFDEVWRLEKIGKDGAFHKRLARERINSVKDFLTLLNLDPVKLRSILGTGMSAKMWEVTVEHARTCVLDTRRYLYFPSFSQPKTGVVFNAVGQVTGLLSECQYVPVDKLSETEKAEAQNFVISAYKQGENVASFEDEASLMDGSSHLTNALYSPSSPKTEGSSANKVLAPQKTSGFDYTQASASSPDIMSSIYSVGGPSGLDDYCLSNMDSIGLRYDPTLGFPLQVTNSLICETDPLGHPFGDEDQLQFFDTTDIQSQCHFLESQADLQSAVDGFMLARSTALAIDKAQRRWRKLFNVLKWFMVGNIKSKRSRVRDNSERYIKGL
ncbi:calmodulin-binding protein 60 A isoform X1 [Senna tora]|uniref:Calmodulin-binding protein 60 A isoform X1 n=1 Tax=Senna tora TaxID=362788 RepID=A0A834W1Z8_9FABA|nr:calmodulin-binding protein 60 A isoform X1 [Senna tora]